jgi:predicted CXXCH cytochrome family protein
MPRRSDHEIDVCAQCHARRVHFAEGYTAGARLLDHYIPVILADLYYPDGQQKGEVYNYGSFVQSRMYSAGVTCSDCHDPHTARLRAPGNQVCTQCHVVTKYDTPVHHHHIVGKPGSACASCHMPSTTYMEIDQRLDHSIRVPRPDLTVAIGVPNACNGCHTDRDPRWAAVQIHSWNPNATPGFQRFATAFASDDRHDPSANMLLAEVARDSTEPWFVRASALGRLLGHADSTALRAARAQAHDNQPLIRLAALQIAESFGARERLEFGVPMLFDSTRAVRQGAAWMLAPVVDSLRERERIAFDRAANEFVESQRYNADQPIARLVLGMFFLQRSQFDSAEAEVRVAQRLDPQMNGVQQALAAITQARAEKSSQRTH